MSEAIGDPIRWKLHLASSPEAVFQLLTTDAGRACFWAESTSTVDGLITFHFPNGARWQGPILDLEPPHLFRLIYYGGSTVTFILEADGRGGTDLTLIDEGVAAAYWAEVYAGWLSVLLNLKAAADYDIDLRNHDPDRTWEQGFVDN